MQTARILAQAAAAEFKNTTTSDEINIGEPSARETVGLTITQVTPHNEALQSAKAMPFSKNGGIIVG